MSKGDKSKEPIKPPTIVKPLPIGSYVKYIEEAENEKQEISSR